jgi:hypothetical protein
MAQPENQQEAAVGRKKSRRGRRAIALSAAGLLAAVIVLSAAVIAYNNLSLCSDAAFAVKLDAAIANGDRWVAEHRAEISETRNAALLTMLRECSDLNDNAVFEDIVNTFLKEALRNYTRCWKREIDPNWPVDAIELHTAISKENIDNQWALYAVAPDKAGVTAEQLDILNRDRWQGRQLTHQLFALTMLRDRNTHDAQLDELIEHLCDRLSGELVFDAAVVDIYIQKVMFVLRAGHPDKIRRRWVERIIANQGPDGGWNDRWLCLTSARRPRFDSPPSDQHATIQAVAALYLVRYAYADRFGIAAAPQE